MGKPTKIKNYLNEMHDEFEKSEFVNDVQMLYRNLSRAHRKVETIMSKAGCQEYMDEMEEVRHMLGGQGMGGMVQEKNILGKLREILGGEDEPNKDDPEKPYIKP